MLLTGLAAAGLLVLLLFALFAPLAFPSVLNVAVTGLLGYKFARRWPARITLAIALSALISLNVRIPALLDGDPNEARTAISSKTVIGPEEKVRLETEGEYVYYRRDTAPPRYGLRNDWSIGFAPLETTYEKPAGILLNLGIARTSSEDARVVVRVHQLQSRGGIMEVHADVLVEGKPAASYVHRVRKSYLLEEFDWYGKFNDNDWRPAFLYLTQFTFWVPQRERIPRGYHPLQDFLQAALAQGGVSPQGAPVTPLVERLGVPDKLRKVSANVWPEMQAAVPPRIDFCNGEDAGHGFTAGTGLVEWKDRDIPPLQILPSSLDGRYIRPDTVFCAKEPNRFWVAAYHIGSLHLWQYRVDFNARSLFIEQWLQHELSSDMRALFDATRPRILQISGIGDTAAELYLVQTVGVPRQKRKGKVRVRQGYRVEMALR